MCKAGTPDTTVSTSPSEVRTLALNKLSHADYGLRRGICPVNGVRALRALLERSQISSCYKIVGVEIRAL
jgi:hypothetical protein